mgnify:FL=1
MEHQLSLLELGQQYLSQAKVLYEKVEKLRQIADDLPPEKRLKMYKRIRSVWESAVECRNCARQLIGYYESREDI